MRYFWVNPYSRTLLWSEQPPSHGRQNLKPKFAVIQSMQWTDPPAAATRNFLPTSENCIIITTSHRTIRLLPISWHDHDQWVHGISSLLSRAYTQDALLGFRGPSHEFVDSEFESDVGTPTTPRHGRVNTIVSKDAPSTPLPLHKRLLSREFKSPYKMERKSSLRTLAEADI